MMRIGVRSLEEALRGMGGDRDLERSLSLHFGRLGAALAQVGGPTPGGSRFRTCSWRCANRSRSSTWSARTRPARRT